MGLGGLSARPFGAPEVSPLRWSTTSIAADTRKRVSLHRSSRGNVWRTGCLLALSVFLSVACGVAEGSRESPMQQKEALLKKHEEHRLPLLLSIKINNNVSDVNVAATKDVVQTNVVAMNAQQAGAGAQTVMHTKNKKLGPRSWFAFTFSFAFVIKALCMFSNAIYQMSPFPQVRDFQKVGTGEIDAAPYISILYGGAQWCFYGCFAFVVTKKSGFLVLVYSNVLGAMLGVYYVIQFQLSCRNPETLNKFYKYIQVAGTLIVVQAIAIGTLPREQALFFCGVVSAVCSVVGACSLLTTVPIVLSTRCSASINANLVVVGIGCNILWLICGIILADAWIIVPQVAGLVFQITALSLCIYFPRDPAKAIISKPSLPHEEARYTESDNRSVESPFRDRNESFPDYGCCGETGGTGDMPQAESKAENLVVGDSAVQQFWRRISPSIQSISLSGLAKRAMGSGPLSDEPGRASDGVEGLESPRGLRW